MDRMYLKGLYIRVFDDRLAVRNCRRDACSELIRAVHEASGTWFGDAESGIMDTQGILAWGCVNGMLPSDI